MYDSPCPIRWDHRVFGVNNGDMSLYVYINDIMEIVMGKVVKIEILSRIVEGS